MAAIAIPLAKAIAAVVVSTVLSKAFSDDPKTETPEKKGHQVNTQSMKVPMPLIYGQTRIGINRAYIGSTGDNKYLHIIGILGEGEIDGFSAQVNGVEPVYFDDKLYTDYGAGNVHFELFTGTAAQTVCSTLNTAIPEWTDPLKNTAYIYLRLKFDGDKFQNVPQVTVGIKGIKIYNPTTTVTEYTNNPALCVYDMLTRSANRGGFGLSDSRINTASIEDARAYCASKGWTCNMPVVDNQSITDNIQLLMNNFRGGLIKSTNQFYLKFRDLYEESVVMAFDAADNQDILDGSLTVNQPDLFSSPTSVNIEYLSEEGGDNNTSTYKRYNYIHSDTDVDTDETFQQFKIECLGLSDLDMVQQMAYYFSERHKLTKTCSFTAGQKAASLEPLDLITLTHRLTGWDTKIFRVMSVQVSPDYTVGLSCIEENEDFYDSVYDATIQNWYDTTLPDPLTAPTAVINTSLSEEVYYYRNRSFTRLLLNFSAPAPETDPFFDYAEVYMKIGSGDYKYITKSEGDYIVDPVDEGDTYYFKLKSVNIFGNKAPDTSDVILSKTVVGKTSTPTNLSSMTAAANGDSVSIYADPISDPDIEGYEVRLGDAWDGAIFVSFNKNCSLRLNGVRPGTHTFWMSPKDNAGKYSGTPVSATVKVFIPPGYTELATYGSESWDFTGSGTFSNTEHDTYDAGDVLKCSHEYVLEDDVEGYSDIADYISTNPWDAISGTTGLSLVSGLGGSSAALKHIDTGGTIQPRWVYNIANAQSLTFKGSFVRNNTTPIGPTYFPLIYDGTTIVGYLHCGSGALTIKESTNWTGLISMVIGTTYDVTLTVSIADQTQTVIINEVEYGPYPLPENNVGTKITRVLIGGVTAYVEDFTLDNMSIAINPNNRVGSWLSPTWDMNAVEDVRLWGDFLTAFESSDTTWDGVAPSPTTWNDLGSSLSWNEIFEASAAGKVQATLYHSTDNTTWYAVDFFEIICAEVSARYVKVLITITDPTLDANLYLKELNMVAYEGPQ